MQYSIKERARPSGLDLSSATCVLVSNEVTARLTQIWEEMLGIRPITPDQNYFELGGDSILAVELFTEIEKEFQINLPLASLFDAPTIAELALVIQQKGSLSAWSPIVAIQPSGTRPPFFCMHGAGGNVLIYRDLARHLGTDQPFYGLQAQGLDGHQKPLTTIEEMAALYLQHIRRIAPRGPYFVGGYCGGGTIAFEVAHQLQAAGEEVALLALFDTMNWSNVPLCSLGAESYYFLQKVVFHGANFFRLDPLGQISFLIDKVKTARSRLPVWKDMLLAQLGAQLNAENSRSRILGQIWRANDQACIRYVPKPYAGIITDFRPMRQYRMYDLPGAKWDRLAQSGQDIIVLPVYPAGMLLNPFVKHLAVALGNSIDNAMRRCSIA